MSGQLELSIIAPMFNEEESVAETARRVREAMAGFTGSWELVMLDDGSTDGSRARAEAEAARDPRVRVVGYTPNAGRGRALRTGFAAARGRFVVSVDFDLSYDPAHVLRMHQALAREGGPDLVLVSAYMPGGTSEGVSWKRLLPSRLGNWLLRFAWPRRIYTSTCIVRGYRREALKRLALAEDGKEIHLEILSQAFERGLRIEEIPGHLRARARGRSKARLGGTIGSHLAFLARRRPLFCAGVVALGLALVALAVWASL
ncbi:MAG: glycosyltransferase [Planctomycetes bacterium]|nr:glycosyltransferase [Planctomycetota bacterium]